MKYGTGAKTPLRVAILIVASLHMSACGGSHGGGPPNIPAVSFSSDGIAALASPKGIAVADFNGDRKPDLAVASSTGFQVTVYLNSGAPGGTPSFGAGDSFATVTTPVAVAAADFNGDGRPDLVVANYNSDSISVYFNATAPGAGTATFSAKVDFVTGSNPDVVVAADINSDGLVDLAVANWGSSTLSIFRNTTAPGAVVPSFAARVDVATDPNCSSIVAADLQGDGLTDLVIASSNAPAISALLNTTTPGSATISLSAKVDFAAPAGAFGIVAFDANFDGRPDIGIADLAAGMVSIYRNTTPVGGGTPSFASRIDVPVGYGADSITSADFDGDGRPDLAFGNSGGASASVLVNRTSPGFTALDFTLRVDIGGAGPTSLAAGDFNLDGMRDIAFITSGSVQCFRNLTSPPPSAATFVQHSFGDVINIRLADFDGDGKLDVAGIVATGGNADSIIVLRNTTPNGAAVPVFSGGSAPYSTGTPNPGPICPVITDINVDGKPDIAVVNRDFANVAVFLNTTAPGSATITFATRVDFATGTTPIGVAAGDLNGDGMPDLVVANTGSNSVSVLINTTVPGSTTPSFAAKADFAAQVNPRGVAVGDLNGDGKPDVVATNGGSATASVFLNTTATGGAIPTFAARIDFSTGQGPHGVTLGDVNQDGRPDVAIANENSSTATILVNTTAAGAATASFSVRSDFPTGTVPHWIALADLTGDGKLDMAVGTRGLYFVSVLLNNGVPGFPAPSFSLKAEFGSGNLGDELGVGDMNGDGKPDIVTGAAFNHFDVLIQQ